MTKEQIEQAARDAFPAKNNREIFVADLREAFVKGAEWYAKNQWISVEEALPTEKRIIAKLSKFFCGKDVRVEILYRIAKEHIDLKHPDGYYDLCGENIPTSAITHWMPIPSLKGGEE